MRNLDSINPEFAKPSSMSSLAAILPFISGACGVALAGGAAPDVPFRENPLSVLCAVVVLASFVSFFVPRIFNWGWQTKYFGVGPLYVGSIALMGIVPWLCIGVYSALPVFLRVILPIAYAVLMFRWCWRFVLLYKNIYDDDKLRRCLYEEEHDVVYYIQKGDAWLIEKKLKFSQFPQSISAVGSLLLAFSIMPFMGEATAIVGLPFTHIFLAIGAIPIDMMALGLATRAWLIFYHYPGRIRRETGKRVCVDMASKPARI